MINMNYSTNIMIITYQNTTLADLTLILSTREVLTPLNGPSFLPNNFDLLLP